MTYSLIYSPEAIETFDSITDQVNSRWGAKYTNNFRHRTSKTIKTIEISPFIYQAINADPNIRKANIHRNCSVFYEVSSTQITILFFWDNRQEPIF